MKPTLLLRSILVLNQENSNAPCKPSQWNNTFQQDKHKCNHEQKQQQQLWTEITAEYFCCTNRFSQLYVATTSQNAQCRANRQGRVKPTRAPRKCVLFINFFYLSESSFLMYTRHKSHMHFVLFFFIMFAFWFWSIKKESNFFF